MGLLFNRIKRHTFTDEDRELSLEKRKLKLNKDLRSDKLDALSGIKDVVQVMADIDTAKNQLVQPYLDSQPSESSEDNELIGLVKMFLQQNPGIMKQQTQPAQQDETPKTQPASNIELIVSKLPMPVRTAIKSGTITKKLYDTNAKEEAKKISDEVYDFILKN